MATIIIASIPNPNPNPLISLPYLTPTRFKVRKINILSKKIDYYSSSNIYNVRTSVVRRVRATTTSESNTNTHRIWRSDVVVNKPKQNVFIRSKWTRHDIRSLFMITTTHVLAMFAPFHFSWGAFWVALVLQLVTGVLGITLSYHRNLTHNSFKLPKWLEYFFAYLGVLAMQEDPIKWVSHHRCHHKFCDTKRDPHSPRQGFWFSHINWIFDNTTLQQKIGEDTNTEDLERQPFYRFIRSTYMFHIFAVGALLYAFGGFSYLAWGMGVRGTLTYHFTFFAASACHIWGHQAWNTGDLSKNNWWVAMLTGGEGWHNNHHAFEYSARHGLEWWQIDLTWYIIKFLETLGLAKDVKLPTQAHKQRLSLKPN